MPESTAPPRLRIPGAPLTFEPHAFSRPRPNGHKRPPSGQRFHLWVSGCQMNESDADYLSQGLTAAGFSAVPDLDQADLAILVTCSVRQNAEQKAYGRFRELKAWKQARPGRAIAITGCMANKEKDRLYERLPDLDYRFDMRQYEAFIQDLQGEYETDPAQTGGAGFQLGLTAYVPVIFGCNEVCRFCIVPFVGGTQRSPPLTHRSRPTSSSAIRAKRKNSSRTPWRCSRRSSSTWSTSKASRRGRGRRRRCARTTSHRRRRSGGSTSCSTPSDGSPKRPIGAG